MVPAVSSRYLNQPNAMPPSGTVLKVIVEPVALKDTLRAPPELLKTATWTIELGGIGTGTPPTLRLMFESPANVWLMTMVSATLMDTSSVLEAAELVYRSDLPRREPRRIRDDSAIAASFV